MTPESLLASHSNRFSKFYESSNNYDVSIIVGAQCAFPAHFSILVAHSRYFAMKLSDMWIQRELDKPILFEKSDISPQVFKIILRYLYSGKIELKDIRVPTLLDLLIAANELLLDDDLLEYIQLYLLENHYDSMIENFASIDQVAFKHNFTKLRKFSTDIMCKNPAAIFHSSDFSTLQESTFVCLLERDDLNLPEIEIWEKLLEWGIAQASVSENGDLTIPVNQWSQTEFEQLGSVIKNCLHHIRFFHINSVDFYNKVTPYLEHLSKKLYDDLLQHYLVPGSKKQQVTLHPIREAKRSKILLECQLHKITEWIKRHDSRRNNPIGLKLLFRASIDGSKPEDFHRLCDNKGPTITVVRIHNSEKIIGGYNSLEWNSLDKEYHQKDSKSFLFTFDSDDIDGSSGVFSKHVYGRSIRCGKATGPVFGKDGDLALLTKLGNFCKKSSYEYGLLSLDSLSVKFDIYDYEVFQIAPK